MPNVNQQAAAKRLAFERGLPHAAALRLVRDEKVLPQAWTYTYLTPDEHHYTPDRRDALDQLLRNGEGFDRIYEDAVFEMVSSSRPWPVLSTSPELPATGLLQIRKEWSPAHRERYPELAWSDPTSPRLAAVFYEPYDELVWAAATADDPSPVFTHPRESLFPLPSDRRLLAELLDPPGLESGSRPSDLMSPPHLPQVLAMEYASEGVLLGELTSRLEMFVGDWPTSVAGWALLGLVWWDVAFDDVFEPPAPDWEKAGAALMARSAWTTGVAIAELTMRRSALPPGTQLPSASRENRDIHACLLGLLHLNWAEGRFDEATTIGRNLLVLDPYDAAAGYRRMLPLQRGEEYSREDPENNGPRGPWSGQFDDLDMAGLDTDQTLARGQALQRKQLDRRNGPTPHGG